MHKCRLCVFLLFALASSMATGVEKSNVLSEVRASERERQTSLMAGQAPVSKQCRILYTVVLRGKERAEI